MATSNHGEQPPASTASPSHSPAASRERRRSSTHSRSPSGSEDGETRSPRRAARSQSPADPPLPDEEAPPLPEEAPPEDDGWDALWDQNAQAYYFYNRFTQATQWENPRVPEASAAPHGSYDRLANSAVPGMTTGSGVPGTSSPPRRRAGGYNPAIHGSYDPNADYAKEVEQEDEEDAAIAVVGGAVPGQDYAAAAHFNRFTGRFQNAAITPENYNDENKSRRQMSAFFDVDAAANSHDGRSLKAERRGKNLSKKELKAFKEKRRERKEEKRRAWLRD